MKRLIIITLLLAASSAFATGFLQKDNAQNYAIQGFAPAAKKAQALTVNRSGNVSSQVDAAWSVYPTVDGCVFRLQSTATRAGVNSPAPNGAWTTRVVNGDTKFTSFSGCTGVLHRQ